MKYGVLVYGNTLSNIGDVVQTLGVLKVYEEMGVQERDIIKLNRKNLINYSGEKVVLPLAGWFDKLWKMDSFPLSKDIVPVFLGFHCTDEKVLRYLLQYNRKVFGCRDLGTLYAVNRLFDNKITAFMSGCFSLVLDRREDKKSYKKIYMVDVIEDLIPYIPENILDNAEKLTQIFTGFINMPDDTANIEGMRTTQNWLDNFKTSAKLVITSRLHLALPCIAMGIPVIVARKYEDDTDRFLGYNDLFHVYMPDEFSIIDWSPVCPDIEWLKKEIISNAKKLIKATFDEIEEQTDFVDDYKKQVRHISEYFNKQSVPYYVGIHASYLSQQQKENYYSKRNEYNNILEYILKRSLGGYSLCVWGGGDKGYLMMRRYGHIIEEFKSVFYVDSNLDKQGRKLNGFDILNPDIISSYPKDEIIVIVAINHYFTKSAREIALTLSKKYGLEEGVNYFFLDKIDSSARMAIDDIALHAALM